MKKFLSLPTEKQNSIIDAALASFAANGYKKASISDIASAAGISKPMIFHYFGTKKALYCYLVELCNTILMDEAADKFDETITDFFDRVRLAANIKMSAAKKHPSILIFLNSAYFETDDEVRADTKAILAKAEAIGAKTVSDGVDISKFKTGIDPKLVIKMLAWLSLGYGSQLSNKSELDIQASWNEFDRCLDLLKTNFYKEEEL